MPAELKDLPLEDIPVEIARSFRYDNPAILNYADKVNEALELPSGLLRNTIAMGEKSGPLDVSPKNAKGVGQFIDETAKRYGLTDPTDPKASIDAMGKYYMNAVKVTGSRDPAILAAAYNSGENRKELKEGKVPNIKETKAYTQRVTSGMSPAPKGISYNDLMKQLAEETPTKDQISPMLQDFGIDKTPTNAHEAFLKSAGESVLPSVTGLAAFGTGAAAGAWLASPLAALSGPAAPVVLAVAAAAGGISTSFGMSYLTRQAQDYLVSSLPEGLLKSLGMDKATRSREEQEHPYASFAGGFIPSLITFKPGVSTVKEAVKMAGMGGGFEAARELVTDGELDPMKIGLAAVFQGAVSKPNRLGQKLLDSTAWKPLKHLTPKEEYVESVVKKVGVKYKEAAEQLWDKTDDLTHPPKGTLVVKGQSMGEHVKQLQDAQHALAMQRDADKLDHVDFLKSLSPKEFAIATSDDIYHSMPEEVNFQPKQKAGGPPQIGKQVTPLTPAQAYIKHRFIEPLQSEVDNLYKQAEAVGGDNFVGQMGAHNTRTLQRTFLQKIAKIGDDVMGMTGFAREAGTQRARSMFALEFPNGTRKVINIDGRKINGFGADKKPFPLVQLAKTPQVGDIITANGQKGKIVQATTAQIEAETSLIYNKNTLANLLNAKAELKSYIREKQWLDQTMSAMEKLGYAIPKTETSTPPKGFRTVTGDNRLERYYITDRVAETFQDGIAKSANPAQALTKINQAAIGTMFWNPQPHLFNAFDHWFGTMAWDLIKPWQYKSIGRSVYEAYKDVSTLSPAYRDYMRSGMGLNYGRVAVEGVYERMLAGIDKPSMGQLAKSWGTHPTKLVTDIYAGAKSTLWGGSDIMMISAYKHMASKQGVDIFNQSLRNYIEAHNPNYRVPSRIGFDSLMSIPGMPEAAGKAISRNLSLMMQSRAFNTFGRYHYGQFRSLAQDMHDIIIQNEHSVEGRGHALSHAAFVGFSIGVVYPFLWDTLAKVVSGDETATMRRAGSVTVPYTVWHILMGDEAVTRLISEAYSLPPITKMMIEIPTNRNLFTGQHIWEPEDNMLGTANDVGLYVSGQVISPIKTAQQAVKEPEKALAAQVGIKLGQDVAEAKKKKWKARDRAAALRRQKTRGYLEGLE